MYMAIEGAPRFEWNETAYRPVNGNWDLGGSSNKWSVGWFLNAVCVANGAATNASSSADDLVVGDGTGTRGISVYSANNADGHLYFHDAVGGTQGGISYEHTGDLLRLRAGATNRASVGSDGVAPGADATYKFGTAALRWTEGYVNQVLAGGADPTDAASAADDVIVGDGSGSRGISVFSASNADGHLYFHDAVGGTQGGVSYEHTADVLRLRAGATNRASVGADGVTPAADATYKLGTSALRWTEGYVNQMLVAGADASDAISAADDVVVGDGSGDVGVTLFVSSSTGVGRFAVTDSAGNSRGEVKYTDTATPLWGFRVAGSDCFEMRSDQVRPTDDANKDLGASDAQWKRVYSADFLVGGGDNPVVEAQLGDGSDGAVTISSNTTLTRDMYYESLTVNSTKELNAAGFRIFVRGTLTNNGIIKNDGNNGSGGSLGTGAPTGSVGSGANGGAGSATIGGGGSTPSNSLGGAGGAGGSGTGGAGGGAGSATAPASGAGSVRSIPQAATGLLMGAGVSGFVALVRGGAGGGGGGGAGGGGPTGGGGGGGGGVLIVVARELVNAGEIRAKGGNGAAGTASNTGGGGGGGGGTIITIARKRSGAGTVAAAGGTGGASGGGSGNAGSAGSSGNVIELFL
jgi:hypothetical protein